MKSPTAMGLLLATVLLVCGGAWDRGLAQPASPPEPQLSLRIDGQPEVVAPAAQMPCASRAGIDVPDMPASAYRRGDGRVVLLASNRQNFLTIGPDLDRVKREGCQRLITSAGDADPSRFRDQEWLLAVAPLDARRAVAVVHNEHHGELRDRAACPAVRGGEKLCWYASSTLMLSEDGGRTFQRPPAPRNVLAGPSDRYAVGRERVSVSTPKLVRRGEHLYAMTALADRNRDVLIRQCLFRASASAPLEWRAWDGRGFNAKLGSAYAERTPGDCVGVLRGNVTSVRYVPARRAYVALLVQGKTLSYATSPDLVSWSSPKPLRTYAHFARFEAKDGQPDWYFSLLDPTSRSAGFDTLEDRPYLYFTRFHVENGRVQSRRRDLMRVRLAID
jgi:hypothetical protein